MSILIGRGTWPDVFLTGISNQITQTEGAAGTSYWGSDAYPVYDPGFDMPDGSGPAVVNDPMYGVFMAAAINNPAWIIHTYTGHDTTDVIWDNPGYNGSSFDPNKPAHAQVDQSLYDLFKTRGLDAASCAAFLLACGAADATTMSGTPPDGWTPSSTQAIELSLSLKRDGRLYDNKSWWDKYGHQVLGMAAMYFGFVSFVTPIGWAALVFGVASMAAMAGDAVLSFTEGDWVAGLTTLGLLIIVPLVVGKVIRWVSLPVGAAQGLTEAQLARVFAGEIVEDSFGNRFVLLGNKVTAFTKDEWALLETSGSLARDGAQIALLDGKLFTLSPSEWQALLNGDMVTHDGTCLVFSKGNIIAVDQANWASQQTWPLPNRFPGEPQPSVGDSMGLDGGSWIAILRSSEPGMRFQWKQSGILVLPDGSTVEFRLPCSTMKKGFVTFDDMVFRDGQYVGYDFKHGYYNPVITNPTDIGPKQLARWATQARNQMDALTETGKNCRLVWQFDNQQVADAARAYFAEIPELKEIVVQYVPKLGGKP